MKEGEGRRDAWNHVVDLPEVLQHCNLQLIPLNPVLTLLYFWQEASLFSKVW
jgi:hypothetical protein